MEKRRFYFVDNEFFERFADCNLPLNHETDQKGEHNRPCYYCVEDKIQGLFWMIPISSKYYKYKKIFDSKVARNGQCDTLDFAITNKPDVPDAFLLQNAFPITENYIKNVYISKSTNEPLQIREEDAIRIEKKLKKIIKINERVKIIFTDVNKIKSGLIKDYEAFRENKTHDISANSEDKVFEQITRPKNNKEFTENLLKNFIASLDDPIEKWTESWKSLSGRPINAGSNRPYTGLNALQLYLWMYAHKESDPRFATYEQIKKEGWHVKKGQSAENVLRVGFCRIFDHQTGNEIIDAIANRGKYENDERFEIMNDFLGYRFFPLFHASQIEGIEKFKEFKNDKIQMNDFVVNALYSMNIPLKEEKRAHCPFYDSRKDEVHIPPMTLFKNDEGLAVDIIHELSHATGHPNRLNRKSAVEYSSSKEIRAQEELVAEISTVITRASAGLKAYGTEELKNHKAYCQGWKQALSGENATKIMETVAHDAMKASNYIVDHVNERVRNINSLEGFILINEDKLNNENKYEFLEKQTGPYMDFTSDILKAKIFETQFLAEREVHSIKSNASPDFPTLRVVQKVSAKEIENKKQKEREGR